MQKLHTQIRKRDLDNFKQQTRDRLILQDRLLHTLKDYTRCRLISGDTDLLDHRDHYDCEQFAYETHCEIGRLLSSIGVEHCKQLLLESGFCKILSELTDTIENTTVEWDKMEESKHCVSQDRVIDSITELLCRMSEEEELIDEYGSSAVLMLISYLKKDFPILNKTSKRWVNSSIGLVNLFNCLNYEDTVYQELLSGNFELMMQDFLSYYQANMFSLHACEREGHLILLFRLYTEHKTNIRGLTLPKLLVKKLETFVVDFLEKISTVMMIQEGDTEDISYEMVDNILKICSCLHFSLTNSLTVLHLTHFYTRLHFLELFNAWTYNDSALKLTLFHRTHICHLLYTLSDRQAKLMQDQYFDFLVGTLLNLLSNEEEMEPAVLMLWDCLVKTNTVGLVYDQHRVGVPFQQQLANLLELHMPNQL